MTRDVPNTRRMIRITNSARIIDFDSSKQYCTELLHRFQSRFVNTQNLYLNQKCTRGFEYLNTRITHTHRVGAVEYNILYYYTQSDACAFQRNTKR